MNSSVTLFAVCGLVYAGIFLAVCARSRRIALMLIFAGAPFQQDLSVGIGVAFSIAEVNLGLTFLFLIVQVTARRESFRIGPLIVAITAYIIVSVLSVRSWADPIANITMAQIVLYLVCTTAVFCSLGASISDFLLSFYGLIAVCAFLAAISLMSGSYYILGLHKNGLGGSLACGVLVALELWLAEKNLKHRRLLMIAIAAIACGLVFSLSRGAWVGTLAGLAVITVLRRQWWAFARGGMILVPLVAIGWSLVPKEKQDYAIDVSPDAYNVQTRRKSLELAESYFLKDPFLGQGVGLRKEYDATNIIMLTLAETGVVGLVALLAIYGSFIWMVQKTRREIPIASFDFSVMVIGSALMLEKLGHGMFDHFWGRGEMMTAFAGAGMATAVYLKVLRNHGAVHRGLRLRGQIRDGSQSGQTALNVPHP